MIKDDVTWVITSLQFDENRSVWTVRAARVKIHKYDSRMYEVDTKIPCVIPIDVGKEKSAVGPPRKASNKSRL
jgi:hypothetical protein